MIWNKNMKVTPAVIVTSGSYLKNLMKWMEESEIEGGDGTTETTALLKLTRTLKRAQETWGDLVSSERPSTHTDVKNSR